MEKSAFLSIGKIVGAHGVRGIVKVYSYAESPSVFDPDSHILFSHPQGWEKNYEIRWVKPHKRVLLLSLEGVDSREAANALIGGEFLIKKATLPELEEDTYYWSDLMGLSVFTTDETYLGQVTAIIPTGSNDVYVVKEKTRETLIPALESVVIHIDLEKKIMRVDMPEGL